MQNNGSDTLTPEDIKVLVTSFPDLKRQLPENVGKEDVMSFMTKIAEEYGVEYGAQQVLEYTATAAAMKLRAKIALGELKKEDLAFLEPNFQNDIMQKAEIFKQSSKTTEPTVNCGWCMDIRDMDFTTAVSVLPLHEKICRQFFHEKLPSAEGMEFLTRDDSYKFMNLTMITGNETASGRCLETGEFTQTVGRRLINGPIEAGDNNDIFKTFATLSLLNHSLQCHAAIELGKTFPEFANESEENLNFFYKHALETLTVCQACKEQGRRFENIEQMKNLVASPLTKQFAYDSYAPVFDIYTNSVDIKNARCPITVSKNEENPNLCLPQKLPKNKEFTMKLQLATKSTSPYKISTTERI